MIIEKGNAFICQVNHRYKYVESGTLCPTYWFTSYLSSFTPRY